MYQLTQNRKDSFFKSLVFINGAFSVLCVLLIFIFLLKESAAVFYNKEFSLFYKGSWYPLEGKFNILPMIVGSFVLTLGSIVIALPLGIFTAMYQCFYLPKIWASVFRRLLEVYTGIPSVIFGFWGLVKVVPIINQIHPPGQSVLAGVLILSLMIFPIISLNIIVAMERFNTNFLLQAAALSFSKSTYIWKLLIPNIKPQLYTSTLLATGRALGETMAVLMVCGNIVDFPKSIFDPVRSLTANIALEMSYAVDEHRSALFLSGFMLMIFVSIIFVVADLFVKSE